MTSCADQCRFAGSHRKNASAYARAYGIAGPIRGNRHTAQYCHLLAQISAQILPPTGAHSEHRLLPRNLPPIGSQTIDHGEHHSALQSILYCNYRQSAINSLFVIIDKVGLILYS